jgi:hypothetical protein
MSSPLTLENSLILACVRTEPDIQRICPRAGGSGPSEHFEHVDPTAPELHEAEQRV